MLWNTIGDSLLEDFLEHSKHPIYELEIFPVLSQNLARALDWMSGCLLFDKDAASSSLIRAEGATPIAQAMLNQFVKLEKTLRGTLACLGLPGFRRQQPS